MGALGAALLPASYHTLDLMESVLSFDDAQVEILALIFNAPRQHKRCSAASIVAREPTEPAVRCD